MKKSVSILLIITICLVISISVVPSLAIDTKPDDVSIVYETNINGQTYGTAMYASTPNEEPDLILAESPDGTEGYIYSSDLNADLPKNPEDMLAMNEKYEKIWDDAPAGEVVVARYIPLYEADGKTVIGEFPIVMGYKDSETSELQSQLTLE